jgi:hypothetical protein
MDIDFGITRDFVFDERYRLHFRGEAFNLFNHPNLGLPNMAIGNQQACIIAAVVSPERQIQVTIKLYF